MTTYNICHEVGIKASPKAVYQALTDTNKLAGWWTSDTRGNGSKVGDILEFWFGEFCHKFEVVELQPDKIVRWKAYEKEGIDEWAGTEIAFSLNADEKQCFVHFSPDQRLLRAKTCIQKSLLAPFSRIIQDHARAVGQHLEQMSQ